MPTAVSPEDVLGTAMTSAQVAAHEIQMARRNAEQATQRVRPLDRAVSLLVQALAETLAARPYAVSRDSITHRSEDFGFDATCDHITEVLTQAIEPWNGSEVRP